MGLDAVEIILRAEELFAVDIGDEEAAKVETVGQFYELICSKLHISPLQSPVTSEELPVITHREKVFLFLSRHTPLPAPAEALPWSPQSVWDSVVAVFADQQGLSTTDVTYHARIAKDHSRDPEQESCDCNSIFQVICRTNDCPRRSCFTAQGFEHNCPCPAHSLGARFRSMSRTRASHTNPLKGRIAITGILESAGSVACSQTRQSSQWRAVTQSIPSEW
jgi:hypothetical protein